MSRRDLFTRITSRLAGTLPIAGWLPAYQSGWLRGDLIAGLTLAAYVIPQSMAYASLAGLPPHTGLYCYLLAGAAYALFGTSRVLSVGTTSAIALIVGAHLELIAKGDPARHAALAALAALIVAALGTAAWLLRLGQVVHFVSETILYGFKAGAALVIASTQLPKLFGIPAGGDDFIGRIRHLAAHLGETTELALVVGLVAFALLAGGERISRRLPIPLLVVAGSIVLTEWLGLEARGLRVVGEIPGGLPAIGLPVPQVEDFRRLTPLALACFLLAYVEGMSTARALALARGERVDADQELLALGAANFATALGQGFPVSGGMSQSAVNEQSGAHTPVAILVTSGAIALVLLFLTGMFRSLPQPVLAALVLAAVLKLIDVGELRRRREVSRMEFRVAMIALVGVLFAGILQGVLFAAIFSILVLLRRTAAPRVALLGRVPGSAQFADVERHPENERVPGVIVLRPESSVLYFNADAIRESVLQHVAAEHADLRLVVLDLSSAPYFDISGAEMLVELKHALQSRGVALRLAATLGGVRDMLRASGVEEKLGPTHQDTTVETVVDGFLERPRG